jgi:short-subunit dehydrogenase
MHAPVDNGSRTLLLIGPGRYFGTEILVRFAREGFRLATISRSLGTLRRVESELAHSGIKALCEIGDLLGEGNLEKAVNRVAVELDGITCLVYNPKLSVEGSGLIISPDALTQSLAVNITGAVIAIQAALPFMTSTPGACVILTGGGFKDRPDPERFALSVGKAGLHGLALSLVAPLDARGVELKTVIIDGVVRRNGPILPTDLADFYWQVYCASGENVFRYDSREKSDERTFS